MYLYRGNKTDLTGTKIKTAKHISTSLDSTWCLTLVTILLYIVSQASIMLHDVSHTLKNQSIKCLKTMSAGRLSQECIVILSKMPSNMFSSTEIQSNGACVVSGSVFITHTPRESVINDLSTTACRKPNGQSKW